ncbi:MAG TPA: acetyltransferase [Flavobacteriales bacterium]|jgi:sugar O-acyltransferase (sialic acid O-acetyltransferase NeuD family)|nr:acetyltransferase [Flavobacteriales bacterium]MBK6551478.1 acetyltransferase [Flavobacteriales bacterium]MBK7101870.1 acetyltransferase [Flavobacteriales bacterium]MBK7114219.1 acetyltransferase [Flavobacteriales bacterium]MBK8531744.1 acetyltransferase [Flavobacteriales bacterium]
MGKKKLILFGASNFGDEIVQLFRDIDMAKGNAEWDVVGFLDDDDSLHGQVRNGVPVLGAIEWLDQQHVGDYWFVCVIGSPKARSVVVPKMKAKGARFATGIHPSVIISDTSIIAEGTVVTAGNIITTNVQIGAHVIVNLACTIGHYSKIGAYSTINPGANISGDVTLEEGVLIGTNATVLEKKTIGAYSKIGAGAMVHKDVPSRVTAVGVPAKVLKGLAD